MFGFKIQIPDEEKQFLHELLVMVRNIRLKVDVDVKVKFEKGSLNDNTTH